MKEREAPAIPPSSMTTIKTDMMAYMKHGFTLADFVDRNTLGRKYGKDLLRATWREVKKQYEATQNPH